MQLLQKWMNKISDLQNKFQWLLYFSIPKMLYLYIILHHPSEIPEGEKIDCILEEVSFLTDNCLLKRQELSEKIKVCDVFFMKTLSSLYDLLSQ